jgi:hypothetical protein
MKTQCSVCGFSSCGSCAVKPLLAIFAALRWLAAEAWEKINIVGTVRAINGLRKKYGVRFMVAAVIWELVEDVLFPYLSYRAGHPELIPVWLVVHFEPVVYPVFFWAFRTYDRWRGREVPAPERPVVSSNLRSMSKVASHQLVSVALFWLLLARGAPTFTLLAVYTVAMTFFKFVHERIWHDSSWGILEDDSVQWRRVVAKVCTYRLVSISVMVMMFRALEGSVPSNVLLYQLYAFGISFGIEAWWKQSTWGLQPNGEKA